MGRIVTLGLFLLAFSLPLLAADVALVAPGRAPANSHFEISWQGEVRKGDVITFGTEAAKPKPYMSRVYPTKADSGTLRAPEVAGLYTIVYVRGDVVLASVAFEATALTATLDAPDSVAANAEFEVEWTGPANQGDVITIGTVTGRPIPYKSRAYTAKSGPTVKLRTPEKPGDYSVVYSSGRIVVAHIPLRVTGLEATIVVPAEVRAESDFEVKWTGPDNPGDRLAVYEADGGIRPYTSRAYTNGSGGLVMLTAPAKPGRHSVAYVSGSTTVHFVPFEVSDLAAGLEAAATALQNQGFPVRWTGPGNPRDRILLMGEDPNFALSRGYIANSDGDSVAMPATALAGSFELQYVTGGGRVLARRPIEILPAPQPPGTLKVEAVSKIDSLPAVEVILDASGSMLKRQGGKRRIDIAKATLTKLLSETIPAGTKFAMRVFGHKEADSCRTDLEIPLAPLDPAKAVGVVAGIEAKNLAKTPIADSLSLTTRDLDGAGERILILVTDGEETCEGDPAIAIGRLRQQGYDVRVNIVGYSIDEESLKQSFAEWADLGGGAYFDAADESELAAALLASVQPKFVVRNAEGEEVSAGTAGDPPLTLGVGAYTVVFEGSGGERAVPVKVRSDTETTARLSSDP